MPKSEVAASASKRIETMYPEGGPGRNLKARLKAGELLIGGYVAEYTRPSIMKIYQQAGFDFVFIDYEHVFFNPAVFADTILTARDNGLPVIAKTPQLERQEVAKLLECGVIGVQLPRTESREQLETLLSYMKFPPAGTRAEASGLGNSDYIVPSDTRKWMANQDAETTLVAHIETRLGYENAEEIISTAGVDMVYVGPGDFSIEMGQPGDYNHPDVVGPMEEILGICQKYHVSFGTTASDMDAACRLVTKGTKFFETDSELTFIRKGASDLVHQYQQLSNTT